jgi:hypothetical protein
MMHRIDIVDKKSKTIRSYACLAVQQVLNKLITINNQLAVHQVLRKTSHQQSTGTIFLSEQISISHQPNE